MFDTEVRSLTWDEELDDMGDRDRRARTGSDVLRSNAVITAVGFLNRPNIPKIEGMPSSRAPSWHTARWPEGVDVTGKRVAVIGTGCTGYQMIPELALEAEHVVVFQRTPQWLFGIAGYRSPFPPQVNWLDRNLPFHTNFMRLRTMIRLGAWPRMTDIDPDFDDPHAVSAFNKRHARRRARVPRAQDLGDPELAREMTPPHPSVVGATGDGRPEVQHSRRDPA